MNHPDGESDTVWQRQLLQSKFSQEVIADIVEKLYVNYHILLTPQKPIYNTECKISYYYKQASKEADIYAIGKIKEAADQHNVAVNISRCNPILGDPIDCYDINWIPKAAGKHQIVKYLAIKYQVPYDNMFAFGDSQGDIEMLKAVKHGYLVANAVDTAKANFSRITKEPYAEGILNTIQKHMHAL